MEIYAAMLTLVERDALRMQTDMRPCAVANKETTYRILAVGWIKAHTGPSGGRVVREAHLAHNLNKQRCYSDMHVQEAQYTDLQEILPLHSTKLLVLADRKSTRLNSSHSGEARMPSSA